MQTGSLQLKIVSCIHSRSSALVTRFLREMSGLTHWLGQPPSTITSPWNFRLWWLMSKNISALIGSHLPSRSKVYMKKTSRPVKAAAEAFAGWHDATKTIIIKSSCLKPVKRDALFMSITSKISLLIFWSSAVSTLHTISDWVYILLCVCLCRFAGSSCYLIRGH